MKAEGLINGKSALPCVAMCSCAQLGEGGGGGGVIVKGCRACSSRAAAAANEYIVISSTRSTRAKHAAEEWRVPRVLKVFDSRAELLPCSFQNSFLPSMRE